MYRFGWLLLLICLPAPGQEPPNARKVLSRVAETYRRAKSYRVEAVVTNRIVGRASNVVPCPARDKLVVAFHVPDLLRVERATNPRIAVVFPRSPDAGQFHPDFGPPGDLATDDNGPPLPQGQAHGPPDPKQLRAQRLASVGFADYAAIENGITRAETLRQEGVDFEGTSIPCWVIEGSYGGGVHRTFWIDASRNIVLHEVALAPAKGAADGAQVEHTITIQKLVWNPPLDDLFTSPTPLRPIPPSPGPNGVTPAVPLNECRDGGYTEEAYIAHLTGTIMVDFTIDEQGRPTGVRERNHLGLGLDDLALHCVSECRFQPAQKDGRAIMIHVMRTVPFNDRSAAGSPWHLAEAVFHVQIGDSRPVFLKAAYPASAGRVDHQGFAITLQLTIDGQGVPHDIQAFGQVDPKRAKQASAIVSKWRFTPGLRDGQRAPMTAVFRLLHEP